MGFSSVRRKLRLQGYRLWLVVAVAVSVAVYAALGFLALPRLLHDQLESRISDRANLALEIGSVRTNPFTLTVAIDEVTLAVADQREAAGFAELFVNFEVASLWHWAWVFAEVRLADPWLEVVRREQDNTLSLLLPPGKSEPEAEPGAVPRVLFHRLALTGGRLTFRDQTRPDAFVSTVRPIELELENISTLPGESGRNRLVAQTASGGRLDWHGELDLDHLWARGQMTYREDPRLLWRYFRPQLDFELAEGGMARVSFDYRFELAAAGVQLDVSALEAELQDIAARPPGTDGGAGGGSRAPFVELPAVLLEGGALSWPARDVRLGKLSVDEPTVRVERRRDGTLSLQDYLRPPLPEESGSSSASGSKSAAAAPAPPERSTEAGNEAWLLTLEELQLAGGRIDFEDLGTDPRFTSGVKNLSLQAQDLVVPGDQPADAALSFDVSTGGSFSTEGAVTLQPLGYDGSASLQGLEVVPAQPYLAGIVALDIESGTVGFDGQLRLGGANGVDAGGAVTVEKLSVVDPVSDDRFAAVDRARADSLRFVLRPAGLRIGTLTLDAPYLRIFIAEDGTTNIGALFDDGEQENDDGNEEDAAGAPPLQIAVEETRLRSGSARFTDRSLPLPFAAGLYDLEGTLGRISLAGEPAPLHVEGRVGEYGTVAVDGSVELFAPAAQSRIEVKVRNADMPTLSPYVVEFAGREIDGGTLDLDLDYRIRDRVLDASNRIVIDQLELGEQVESADAADVPLALAVALLKDSEGRISVDVPVQGDVGSPEFSIGGVIAQAIRSLLVDIVTSPFALLGQLVGGAPDELDHVDFEPGKVELTPPQMQRIDQLSQALSKRPALRVGLTGPYGPDRDRRALQAQRLDAALADQLALADGESAQQDRQLAALEALFDAEYSVLRRKELRSAFTAEPDGEEGGNGVNRDEYATALRNQLMDAFEVSTAALETLARQRLDAVTVALTERFGVDPSRIQTDGVSAERGEDGEPVALRFRLDSQ